MEKRLLLVADGKMYFTSGDKAIELPSETLSHYIETVRAGAKSKQWKSTGSGAIFLGAAEQGTDPETAVRSISSSVTDVGMYGGQVYYALKINGMSGIYRKDAKDMAAEGVFLTVPDAEIWDFVFDRAGGRMLYSFFTLGEAHLGLYDFETGKSRELTEGESRECDPSFDPTDPSRILYSGCGIRADSPVKAEEDAPVIGLPVSRPVSYSAGPRGIYSLSLTDGTIDTIAEDGKYDYLFPQKTKDGALYYVRRPFVGENGGSAIGNFFRGVLNVLLFPARLLLALFGFLSVFSMKYGGGDPLSGNVKSKARSQKEIFIEGNLINVEKEMKKNRKAGEEDPGYVPQSYRLIRREADGKETVLAGGVCSFALGEDCVYYSNGTSVRRLRKDGKTEKAAALGDVSVIRFAE